MAISTRNAEESKTSKPQIQTRENSMSQTKKTKDVRNPVKKLSNFSKNQVKEEIYRPQGANKRPARSKRTSANPRADTDSDTSASASVTSCTDAPTSKHDQRGLLCNSLPGSDDPTNRTRPNPKSHQLQLTRKSLQNNSRLFGVHRGNKHPNVPRRCWLMQMRLAAYLNE